MYLAMSLPGSSNVQRSIDGSCRHLYIRVDIFFAPLDILVMNILPAVQLPSNSGLRDFVIHGATSQQLGRRRR